MRVKVCFSKGFGGSPRIVGVRSSLRESGILQTFVFPLGLKLLRAFTGFYRLLQAW